MAGAGRIVIAGGGLAAQRAADGLRAGGYDGTVTLLCAEPQRPYDRPPLSKGYLRGQQPLENMYYRPPEWYAERDIELRLATAAIALDTVGHAVTLDGGERLPYDQLLIASGAVPRRVAAPGADLPGIAYLRTLGDADALRAALRPGARLVVVGAGFIGAEVAASARELGLEVVLLELEAVPLLRALGPQVGAIYADIHRDHGVAVYTGEGLATFRGQGRVEEVVTTAGRALACDLALVGVGVRPQLDWLRDSGLALGNGVEVDANCRASLPDIFAAGDVACWPYGPAGRRIRVEHWDNAANQGAHAARAMLGDPAPYAPTPYFWSDQYDLTLQYVGHVERWEKVVFRGDVAARSFCAFYLQEGRLAAALVVNRPRDFRAARRLVEAGHGLDPLTLADPAVDLRTLAPR